MRATAAECLLPVMSQAIRKHLRDRGVGAGVAPEFMAKRNSELIEILAGTPPDAERPEIGEEQVDGRPTLVTCFRVGAVVQAGGETKGIGRRDWPIVSCRAEPPLVRCDGSQASAICGRRSLQGDRSGCGPP